MERSTNASVLRWAIACVLGSAPAAAIHAQATPARGVIDGVVTDTSLVPLEGATAEILASRMQIHTGPNGRFRMLDLSDGRYLLIIRRLGYAPLSSFVTVSGADTARTAFMLRPVAATLDTMVVSAASGSPVLAEFEERRAHHVGQFMTESDIERLNVVATSDLLRTFHSVAVVKKGVLNTRGFGLRQCPYRLFIDGVPIAPLELDADVPPPSQLAGIEVHTNSATVPIQYATFGGAIGMPGGGGAVCGVILFWTKH